jgi:hypothetical protein
MKTLLISEKEGAKTKKQRNKEILNTQAIMVYNTIIMKAWDIRRLVEIH